ncbi:hypothetical protein E1I21_03445 [Microbacterium oleivorans]|uniref:hypothetical protein n=1 Tax=Microbacterium oleivorans TaxID=273677 RepID=UPI0010A55853|nr:hypothetical protein [Microbacterium oleivorans]THE08360.1 hypothetical protein E1I21_03445 [Microbacterium oleivorans]
MTPETDTFVTDVITAADAAATALLYASTDVSAAPLGPHRESMRRAKLLVAVYLEPASAFADDPTVVALAEAYAEVLRGLQSPTGLFLGGDNVESPPDTGFTINDVGDILELVRRSGDARLDVVAEVLGGIADRAAPALLAGGVHTPNHRWELTAALMRLHRHRPDPRLEARAREWLAEGIDIDADGLYSERSANYAVYVSNPSLLLIGDVLDLPELHEIVARNLEATLGLIHPDGSLETVHSRRQDQREPQFPLAPYALHFRRLALETGRGDFAWAARAAASAPVIDPQTALADMLLHPALRETLPAGEAPADRSRTTWSVSGLVVDRTPERTLAVFGGTDYSVARRIRSGLATNPTFLRLFAGDAVLDSVRLSRHFFGLGPFRSEEMTIADERIVLEEHLSPAYFGPLDAARRRPGGDYRVVDEGRFSAAMSFDERPRDEVPLRTRIDVVPSEDGVELTIDTDGPICAWSLEFAFRDGGTFEDVDVRGDGTAVLTSGSGRYRVGGDAIEVGPGTGSTAPAAYLPGEDYDYLGGTDALGGPRLYVTGTTPGRATVRIRRVS